MDVARTSAPTSATRRRPPRRFHPCGHVGRLIGVWAPRQRTLFPNPVRRPVPVTAWAVSVGAMRFPLARRLHDWPVLGVQANRTAGPTSPADSQGRSGTHPVSSTMPLAG
jgi:hypothetical protein